MGDDGGGGGGGGGGDTFSGGWWVALTSSTTCCCSKNFTPVTFQRQSYNRANINFNFPSNNNTATNTYNTGQCITSYGCTARIIGRDNGAGLAATGNALGTSNATSQSNADGGGLYSAIESERMIYSR